MSNTAKKALKDVIVFAVIVILVVYLFGSNGPVSKLFSKNLSFVILPIAGFYVLRLASRTITILIPGYGGLILSVIFGGASFIFLVVTFFKANVFQSSSVFADRLLFSLVIAITGFTLLRLAKTFRMKDELKNIAPLTSAIGYILVSGAVWYGLNRYAQSSTVANGIMVIFVAGFATGGLTSLAAYGKDSDIPFFSDILYWLSESQARNFTMAVLIAVYIIFIHPPINRATPYSLLIEWGLAVVVIWLIYRRIRFRIRESYTDDIKLLTWEKHQQILQEVGEEWFDYLTGIQKKFVETSDSTELIIALVLLLDYIGIKAEGIQLMLQPIINHRNEEAPWFASAWTLKNVENRNAILRKRVLNEVVENIMAYSNNPSKLSEEGI